MPEVTVFSLDHPETQDNAKFGGPPEERFRRLAKRKVEKGYKDATMVTIRCEDGAGWRTKTVIVSLDKFRDRSGESTSKTLRAWVDGTMALVDTYPDEADEVANLVVYTASERKGNIWTPGFSESCVDTILVEEGYLTKRALHRRRRMIGKGRRPSISERGG